MTADMLICSECGEPAHFDHGDNGKTGIYRCAEHPHARLYVIDNEGRVLWR